eukprot:5754396-Prymnesium_polylepis.1
MVASLLRLADTDLIQFNPHLALNLVLFLLPTAVTVRHWRTWALQVRPQAGTGRHCGTQCQLGPGHRPPECQLKA